MEVKTIKPMVLYNKLQDCRHIILFDYREGDVFIKSHIRSSINVTNEYPEWEIANILNNAEKKYTQAEEKYKTKRIRRVVLINSKKFERKDDVVEKWVGRLENSKEFEGYQVMILGEEGYESFREKYPFLCVAQKECYGDKLAEDEKSKAIKLSAFQRASLYAMSKFPTQIIQNKLYVGDIWNSNNNDQIKDLKIQTLFDFVNYTQQQQIPQSKPPLSYTKIPMSKLFPVTVDFDTINQQIDAALLNGPVLLYCRDGNQFAPAFAIAYLMYKQKHPFQISSLKVFQALSSADICKWIYTQITVYNPKKID